MASGVTLVFATVLAAYSPIDTVWPLMTALILLGVGWNFGLISGTAIVVDSADKTRTAKVQGSADVFIALAGAAGSVLSGFIVSSMSYAALGVMSAVFSFLMIPIILRSSRAQRRELNRS
mgnify:CR=1 FL=1